jgi:hypothetical protein
VTSLSLAPPSWAKDPKRWPTAGESASVVQAAIHAASYTPKRRVVEATRKVVFKLTKTQEHLIPIVARYQQNADAEVFSAYYVGLELAVACSTTQLESGGRGIYGSDPASSWMNASPWGRLWGEAVTKDNFAWFWECVSVRGYTSNGVHMKQLTSPSLIAAANARGGAWNAQHNAAEGNKFFIELINQSGGSVWTAAYHYNGAGQAAVDYANEFVDIVAQWQERLA